MRRMLLTSAMLLTMTSAAFASNVRVVHASPDTVPVDIIVNDDFENRAFTNLAFEMVSDYAALPADTYNFKAVVAGTKGPAPINADVPIAADTDYTIAAAGLFDDIAPVVFEDDNTIAPGQTRVRFLHLSPDAPAVDVSVAGGGPTLFDAVSFTESGGYQTVDAGTYDLDVTLDSNGGLALALEDITLEANRVYTVYATGLAGDGSLNAVISVDAVPEPGSLLLLSLAGLGVLRRRG